MTPPGPYQYDRRRAEDVFRVVEEEVFPRLGSIDTKIDNLEHGLSRLTVEGCAHRVGDLHRTAQVEASTNKIFDRIEEFGAVLSEARIDMVNQVGGIRTDMQKQIGGIKIWVLTGVVVILVAIAGFFLQRHFENGDSPPAQVQQYRK